MVPPRTNHVHELLEKAASCAGVFRMYGLGEGLLQIVGGGPVVLVRLAAVGVLLAALVLEPVHDELVDAYAGLQVLRVQDI